MVSKWGVKLGQHKDGGGYSRNRRSYKSGVGVFFFFKYNFIFLGATTANDKTSGGVGESKCGEKLGTQTGGGQKYTHI